MQIVCNSLQNWATENVNYILNVLSQSKQDLAVKVYHFASAMSQYDELFRLIFKNTDISKFVPDVFLLQ